MHPVCWVAWNNEYVSCERQRHVGSMFAITRSNNPWPAYGGKPTTFNQQCVVFAGAALSPAQHAQNICKTFVQRRPNVFDAGPTLYKCCTNGLCLLGVLSLVASDLGILYYPVLTSCPKLSIRCQRFVIEVVVMYRCTEWSTVQINLLNCGY